MFYLGIMVISHISLYQLILVWVNSMMSIHCPFQLWFIKYNIYYVTIFIVPVRIYLVFHLFSKMYVLIEITSKRFDNYVRMMAILSLTLVVEVVTFLAISELLNSLVTRLWLEWIGLSINIFMVSVFYVAQLQCLILNLSFCDWIVCQTFFIKFQFLRARPPFIAHFILGSF